MVQTLCGRIAPEELGHCQIHEHIWVRPTPMSEKNPALAICDYEKSLQELKNYKARGGCSFVDAQPVGAGRDAETLQKLNPSTNIIFLTGHPEYAYQALNLHCSGYVLKPLTPEKIKKELAHLRFPLRGIRETAGAENGSTDKNEAPEQE
jgi:predicted metal-dependent phosphotriesterase family hydrolase